MYTRIINLPLDQKDSIFLFGPRGVGKTQWIKSTLSELLYLDLLHYPTYSKLVAQPHELEYMIPRGYLNWIVIDEVQRVPELLNEVHRLIEHKNYRFLLTGSSARSLKRRGVNLLAGRALRYFMHPLTLQELGEDFVLSDVLQYGLLPATKSRANPKKYLETYVQSYVREEVLQEGLTRNIGAFNRFLEIASFSQGSVLNISGIAREVGVDRQMIASYFGILEDLLIAVRLPIFSKRAKRRLITHEKFYYFDVGVYRALRPTGPLDVAEQIEGAALETLFFQSMRAINDYYDLGYTFYYWRTSHGVEVDFVLYGPKGLYAFEIKRSKAINGKSLTGLKSFKADYPEAKLYLIYFGELREYREDIDVIPFVEALKSLVNIL